MKVQEQVKELETYVQAIKKEYKNLSNFEALQIAVKLMNVRTVEEAKKVNDILIKRLQ